MHILGQHILGDAKDRCACCLQSRVFGDAADASRWPCWPMHKRTELILLSDKQKGIISINSGIRDFLLVQRVCCPSNPIPWIEVRLLFAQELVWKGRDLSLHHVPLV